MEDDGILSPAWIAAIYGVAGALAGGAGIRGVMIGSDAWILSGLIAMVLTITTLPICIGIKARSAGGSGGGELPIELDRIRTQIRTLNDTMTGLTETIVLSDDARRVINRRKEREMLCRAIEEDIAQCDWEAGMVLVRELAERFGYRAEAEAFREKIDAARSKTQSLEVREAIKRLEGLIASHKWEDALGEAARISRVYHDEPQVEGLRHRVISAKDHYKYEIERRFLHAAQEDRVEEAMDLLHEMDQYLSEHEAEQFREVARGVIGKARDNLGVQFKLAVNDKAWDRAANVGQRIIDEFPNSRMATEIRSMIDEIRGRAESITR